MAKKPGQSVRGSNTGRPIMVLFDLVGQRWVLRILWELQDRHLSFRNLQAQCGGISPTSLNNRLKNLRELQLVELDRQGYCLTAQGKKLGERLMDLSRWADEWAQVL